MNNLDEALIESLTKGEFEFIDMGCGAGESIGHCQKKFDRKPGIGFDIAQHKIDGARENKYSAILADVVKAEFPENSVAFCTMMDFLEHLKTLADAVDVLRSVGRIARDFLFIRHPSFEEIDYLERYGLKLTWTDWSGHPNMMLLSDYEQAFRTLGFDDYVVVPQRQILDSHHQAIVPIDAPINTIRYDESEHGPKPLVYFNQPVWTQFDIFVRLNPNMDEQTWRSALLSSCPDHRIEQLEQRYRKLRDDPRIQKTDRKTRADLGKILKSVPRLWRG